VDAQVLLGGFEGELVGRARQRGLPRKIQRVCGPRGAQDDGKAETESEHENTHRLPFYDRLMPI
jgi:hypothetical protein